MLIAIADAGRFPSDDAWLDAVALAAETLRDRPGCWISLRVKGRVSLARKAIARAGRRLLLGGTTAEALEAGAGGVLWPEAAIPKRREHPPGMVAGASVHSLDTLSRAQRAGADFAVFGPVFRPSWKDVEGVGLAELARVARASPLPLVAIGGIGPEHLKPCREAGARGIAVLSGISRLHEYLEEKTHD